MVDWIEKSIGDLFAISGGRSVSRAQLSDSGYFYLHYGDIHASTKTYIDTEEDKAVIPRLNVPLNKVATGSLLQDGDVVFVDASEDDIGASKHIVVRNTGEVPFIAGLHTIVVKPLTDETDRTYRQYCFQTADVIRQFIHYAAGTKVTGVSKTTIKKITIRFPKSLSEQRTIASALSDADSYIAALERLIAKKRDIKQGAMQDLLSGRRRLQGFCDEWTTRKIGEFAQVVSGGTPSTFHPEYWGGNIPWMNSGELNLKRVYAVEGRITEAGLTNSSTTKVPKNSVLIGLAGQGKTRGTVAINYFELCTNQSIAAVFPNETEYSSEYLYQNLCSRYEELRELSTGDGGRGGLNLTILRNIDIPFPSLDEQTCIATVLSEMDGEIDALKAKLNKAKLIKKGMMEQLLTGKIRLAETNKQGYKEGFRDAVILVALVKTFGTEEHPFTAFDCQKFPYLFHRHVEGNTQGYKKFKAGPYNPSLKYKTARPIALGKNYIREHNGKYKGFVVSDNADEALGYFAKWYGDEPLKWLLERFRYVSNRRDKLELLTTTDKAMVELRSENKPVTTQAVKDIIKKSSAWKDKLKRPIFSDANITHAIKWSNELFGQEVTGNA